MLNSLKRIFAGKPSPKVPKSKILLDEVFSLQAIPTLTYIDRSDDRNEIRDLRASLLTPGKLVCIHGESKSGKTTFVREMARREECECIRIEGPKIQDVETFWDAIGQSLRVAIEEIVSISENASGTERLEGDVSGKVWTPVGNLTSKIQVESLREKARSLSVQNRSLSSVRQTVVDTLIEGKIWVVVDDFHMACRGTTTNTSEYHPSEKARLIRHSIFEDIKSLVGEDKIKFVFISIPRGPIDVLSSSASVSGDDQLSGRVAIEEFPSWDWKELIRIPLNGFKILGMQIDGKTAKRIAVSSLGSPLNTHQICHRLCINQGIRSTDEVDDKNRSVTLKHVTIAIQDFIRSMDLYDGYCEQILSRGADKSGASVPFNNRMVDLNEAITMGLARSYIHSEFGLRIDKLKQRIDDLFPAHRWSESHISGRLAKMSEAMITRSVSSNDEFSLQHQPIIFDQEVSKVYLVDPGLSMYLGEKYRRDFEA